ncbi:7tm 6 domain containing protein [Asbolus verrucosus]|uniref:Odorant receptor n=1 Tax=Asbolus verrucosus TaxID=1661398 RepID=A0A482VMW1_ASBVE|nr:7tm 6 domain containing protein [Asbolus verrucosus]
MEKFDWTAIIRPNVFSLKLVGLWPEGNDSYKFNFYTLYAIFCITLFVHGHNFTQILNIIFVVNDLEAASGTIYISLILSLAVIKTYCIIGNMKILKRLMVNINSDIFQPKSEKQRKLTKSNLSKWKRFYVVFTVNSSCAVFFLCTFPILDKSVKEYRLPLMAWYPYNTKVSPFYEITYVYQCVSLLFIAITNVSTDTLIAALNMYIGAQCDIFCDDLRNLRNEDVPGDINEILMKCITHHKKILEYDKIASCDLVTEKLPFFRFASDSNKFFNWIVFAQFFVNAISIALCLFRLTVVTPFSNEFYTYAIYEIAIIMEIFMYCWFGNEVKLKSKKIPYAIFESDWNEASLAVKKKMVFFTMRCQTPIKLSAVNLFYLSIKNFIAILRTTWSYFAVLHQVNNGK